MSTIENNRLARKKSTAGKRGKRGEGIGNAPPRGEKGADFDSLGNTFAASRQFGYYAEFTKAQDIADLKNRIAEIVNRLGFSEFSFVRLESMEQVHASILLAFPSQLCKTYCEENFHKRDMLIPFVTGELKPLYLSTLYDYALRAPVDMVMIRAIREIRRLNEAFGYFDAYHIPLVSRNGIDRVMFSVTEKSLSPIDFKLKMESCETTLQILAKAIDAIITEKFPELLIVHDEREETIAINPGPLRVLDTLANSDLKVSQVANKLCISIVTANKHLEAVRKVLGVKTNFAAIRKAVMKGLICFDKEN